jgi:hypothetical protein
MSKKKKILLYVTIILLQHANKSIIFMVKIEEIISTILITIAFRLTFFFFFFFSLSLSLSFSHTLSRLLNREES